MAAITQINRDDHHFPQLLKEIPDTPKQLYVVGNIDILQATTCLTVVGSRRPTPYGRHCTQQLIGAVAGRGIVIVSGLALGVDAIAHQAALDAGGVTVAILASGLDCISPRTNTLLARDIVRHGGSIISEYPIGTPPLRPNFIARNRIVSGVSSAVLITEAAAKSGTLHTARFALEQGRTVMAVPGNITSPLSEGTNSLIKAGAIPVTSADDILLAMGIDSQMQMKEILVESEEEACIIELLRQGVSDGSELLAASGLTAAAFNQALTMLEIAGVVRPLGANTWSLS